MCSLSVLCLFGLVAPRLPKLIAITFLQHPLDIRGAVENLSYHQSRHSFGTLAISAGLSIESIAKMMGHANISTTQGYAQITEQKISEDMERLIRRRARRQDESPSKM